MVVEAERHYNDMCWLMAFEGDAYENKIAVDHRSLRTSASTIQPNAVRGISTCRQYVARNCRLSFGASSSECTIGTS